MYTTQHTGFKYVNDHYVDVIKSTILYIMNFLLNGCDSFELYND